MLPAIPVENKPVIGPSPPFYGYFVAFAPSKPTAMRRFTPVASETAVRDIRISVTALTFIGGTLRTPYRSALYKKPTRSRYIIFGGRTPYHPLCEAW